MTRESVRRQLLLLDDVARGLGPQVDELERLVSEAGGRVLVVDDRRYMRAEEIDQLRAPLTNVVPFPDERLMRPSEVAVLFGVHVNTVTGWARAGRLPFVRTLGGHRRYRRSDVRRLLESGKQPSDPR